MMPYHRFFVAIFLLCALTVSVRGAYLVTNFYDVTDCSGEPTHRGGTPDSCTPGPVSACDERPNFSASTQCVAELPTLASTDIVMQSYSEQACSTFLSFMIYPAGGCWYTSPGGRKEVWSCDDPAGFVRRRFACTDNTCGTCPSNAQYPKNTCNFSMYTCGSYNATTTATSTSTTTVAAATTATTATTVTATTTVTTSAGAAGTSTTTSAASTCVATFALSLLAAALTTF
eukprot:TRINITY_DN9246_c0_g1_i1.p1 TRINITY_DN9246_c0_g1~~TRINITY_DN9246_c0_g1_i1.p1  ORF type:complete len:230 (+),score=38.85 TRINITY_DN9246_c0_g1_i1:67-756(+)